VLTLLQVFTIQVRHTDAFPLAAVLSIMTAPASAGNKHSFHDKDADITDSVIARWFELTPCSKPSQGEAASSCCMCCGHCA
jgi:hypothetical protein